MQRLNKHLIALIGCFIAISMAAQKKPKPELYVPMDYSTCGYHASEAHIPDVPVATYVAWQEGDCAPLIQRAIDRVARRQPDKNGHRGAVLLGEGRFRLDSPLRISVSGIVLRGISKNGTVLVKHGVDRGALIYVEGADDFGTKGDKGAKEDTLFITADRIPAGSTAIPSPSTLRPSLKPGDRINIVRPCTKAWIESLAMNDFGGDLDYTGWKPGDIDICWDRTVTAVTADSIFIDSPITTTITQQWGGAYILPGRHNGELTECGVEHLTLESTVNDWNPKDEDHCWDGIYINKVRDAWVRHVNFRHFAGSAVNLQKPTSRITIEDCIASEPVSEVGGWRRCVFLTRGQQTLFQRCISRNGIHDFAAGFCAAGPNAFVQCEGEGSLSFSGSIGSWAAGLLFDIVNIEGHDLRFANLEQFQMGTGWNTANSMFWQCTASTILCYSPDADNRCSAHACWGTLTGNANWTSSNNQVKPRSLFYSQLEHRIANAPDTSKPIDAPDGFILPRADETSSSPTVEEAMLMAQQSLTEPRLTMEMWIDQQANKTFKAPLSPPEKEAPLSPPEGGTIVPALKTIEAPSGAVGGASGTSFASLKSSTGNQYSIPWWNGRVKDSFLSSGARPAITRFVPGREGTGLTDRLDTVVNYLADNGYCLLEHHYGLWYDLRRIDHERVRRADGDVWAPFYEQPFARSGRGTAWDGLSRYDLTRPNKWYWQRLRQFADKANSHGILLFNEHYFQHNILEAGAHWVDCPWRPVNNINYPETLNALEAHPSPPEGGTIAPALKTIEAPSGAVGGALGTPPFPEPVPFVGDKRVFMAEQFYNEQDSVLQRLHRHYIRMCLDELKDQPNVIHAISAEYTGPLHFTRFWLQTIAEWEAETGRHPLVALSCTKDVQDSLLADPELQQVVDIIDIRYWHYNTKGLWAPEGGRNLAPRQFMRKMPVGSTDFQEVYRAVREYRERYPDKVVTYFAQGYDLWGWAVLMAGGSLANVPLNARQSTLSARLLNDTRQMLPVDGENCKALGDSCLGYLLYTEGGKAHLTVDGGRYDIYTVSHQTGDITLKHRKVLLSGSFTPDETDARRIYWLRKHQ